MNNEFNGVINVGVGILNFKDNGFLAFYDIVCKNINWNLYGRLFGEGGYG